MIGYVTIGTRDMDKAKAFYGELLALLDARLVMDMGRLALYGNGAGKPMLGVCLPYDGQPATAGNGTMVALAAASTEQVDALYAKALELGGSDEGTPGYRLPTFYGAYVRDLDGNKLAFFKMT
ncbi:VOC family protein [Zestomonas thermotolerans]|uniref:VOC family protein n=1 Tax=Zestomonas thermotolerans TaxID=157784 RepID=UPI00037685DA|nr:VOC family protein [Pseudomonas thermotolerans]MBO2510453.1 VOC family protein [Gammaproteobacteria bacterium]